MDTSTSAKPAKTRGAFLKRTPNTAFAVALSLDQFRSEENAPGSGSSSSGDLPWFIEIVNHHFKVERKIQDTLVLQPEVVPGFVVDFEHQPPFPLVPKARDDGRTYELEIVATPSPISLEGTEFIDGVHYLYGSLNVTFQIIVKISGYTPSSGGTFTLTAGCKENKDDHTLSEEVVVPGADEPFAGWIVNKTTKEITLPDVALTLEIEVGARKRDFRGKSVSPELGCKARLIRKREDPFEAAIEYVPTTSLSVQPTFQIFQGVKTKK
jgi:hypothetical protein